MVVRRGVRVQLGRGRVERLVELAAHLPPGDRALMLARYRDGHTIPHLAALMGRHPSVVARRLASVLRRVRSPEYRLVVTHAHHVPPAARPTARHAIVEGCSIRRTAHATHRSIHRVRRDLDAVRCLAAALL